MIIKVAKYAFVGLGLAFAAAGGYFYLSWQHDNARLRAFAADVLGSGPVSDREVENLNAKVYRTEGFAPNHDYYLFKKLGPTPIQVLKDGGDCKNKSRLVAAILSEYGVKASLVMLSPCEDCESVHTVVEAHPKDGPIVVDPVYDMSFPKPNGGYYDLLQLKNDPDILQDRLRQLVTVRGVDDKISRYQSSGDGSHYGFPKTINLDKNAATRAAKDFMALFVDHPQLVYRPRVLEDPKLFLAVASGCAGAGFLGLALLLTIFGGRKRRRRSSFS